MLFFPKSQWENIRDEILGGIWVIHPSQPGKLPLRRAKMVVQRTSARQFTGPRIIGELLQLKKVTDKNVHRASSDTPPRRIY